MLRRREKQICFLFLAATFILLLTACGGEPSAAEPSPTLATVVDTPAPPTATSVPAAATVNGEVIPLDDFNAELLRFQEAQGELGNTVPVEEASERVLNDLIDQTLLAQGAREAGFSLEGAALDARVAALAVDVGGEENLSTWIASRGYTGESFRSSLKRAAEAAWMRDNILAEVPSTAEQVHAQQILLYNQESADKVQADLASGSDFGELARAYDPKTGGDLGWFPRNYLLEKSIEDAAFALNVGEVSEIIKTEVGFHLITVLEREEDRPLSPDAKMVLEKEALRVWLANAREESEIVQ